MLSPIRRQPVTPSEKGSIQRGFLDGAQDWVTVSTRQKPGGGDDERSSLLLDVDQALHVFQIARAAGSGAPTLAALLTSLVDAISAWEDEKRTVFGGVRSRRAANVAQLKAEAIAERTELGRRIAQMDAIRGRMPEVGARPPDVRLESGFLPSGWSLDERPYGAAYPFQRSAAQREADATYAVWFSDREQLRVWVEEGLRHPSDTVLRNSCQWLFEDNARLYNVVPTHDSSERVRKLEPDRATDSSIAWFPFPYGQPRGAVGGPLPQLYDPLVQTDPASVYADHGGHGTEGWNTPGVVVVTHTTIERGRDAVWQTIKHEVQHDADWHRSAESKRDVTAAERALAELPEDGPVTLRSLTARATARARLRAEEALVRYKTEYRAYSYMGDPRYDDLPHDVANPSESRYDLMWTPRQLAIFEHIRSAYPTVCEAWERDDWTRERHLRRSTSGSLVEPEVIEEFRRRINEYRDPDVEGVNKLNSRRIDALYRALDAVPAGTGDPAHPRVVAVLQAATELDEDDRRYLADRASSTVLHAKIDRLLDGDAWVEALFAVFGSAGR